MTPPTPPVSCESCGTVYDKAAGVVPNCCACPSWRAPCDRCGTPVLWLVMRGKPVHRCTCTATPTEQEAAALAELKRKTQDAMDQERERRAQAAQIEADARELQAKWMDQAANCWDSKSWACSVERWAPRFDWCHLCLHITEGHCDKPRGSRRPSQGIKNHPQMRTIGG